MGSKQINTEDRFWKMVDKKSVKECWEWTGSKYYNGYGQFYKRPMKITAHRFAYELKYGNVSRELVVCHKCDNRSCVNPNHLFIGTQKDNLRDMQRKGRKVSADQRGIKNPKAKLTEKEVIMIRKLYKTMPNQKLADKFNISLGSIEKIVSRTTWRHI